MDMSLAWAAGHANHSADGIHGANQRVRVLARAAFTNGDALRDRIRQLFHSPLGVYVSQVQRNGFALWIEFDTASEDLAFTLKTLKRVLPEAHVEGVTPRVFPHRDGLHDSH